MTDPRSQLDALETELVALEATLGNARVMSEMFQEELRDLHRSMLYTANETKGLAGAIGGSLRRAFDGMLFEGMRLSDAMRGVARSVVMSAYSTAMRPVQNALGGALAGGINSLLSGLLPAAQGAAFSAGRVVPFANGGIVSGPTLFGMSGGLGIMGEAGPEAIMPLTRGADGRLGVHASGGGRPVNVTVNVTTPDVEGFRRSQAQIATQLARLLDGAGRNR